MGTHLHSLLHTQRIKSAKILNPWVLMELAMFDNSNLQDILRIWGKDPVHLLDSTYISNHSRKGAGGG